MKKVKEIETEVYDVVVKHLKQIAKPEGAWNNDMKIYLENVLKNCIEQAEQALELLDEEYEKVEGRE